MDTYGNPVLEQIKEAAKTRPLNDVEIANLRRTTRAEWILANRDPHKEPPRALIGKEPWLDLVERYCLA